MAIERQVTHAAKNEDGDILALCNPYSNWACREKDNAIEDIESGAYVYYVLWPDKRRTEIHVVNGPTGKYLRTDKDTTPRNNLDDLPDC